MSDQYVEDDIYLSFINRSGGNIFPLGPSPQGRPDLLSASYNENISLDSFADKQDSGLQTNDGPQMSEYKVQFNGGTYTLGDFITVNKATGEMHLHPLITEDGKRISPEMWVQQPDTAHFWYPDLLVMKFGDQQVYIDLGKVENLTLDQGVKLDVVSSSLDQNGRHVKLGEFSNYDKQVEINIGAARTYPGHELGQDEEYKIDFKNIVANPGAFIKETEFTTPSSPTPSADGINPPKGFLNKFGELIPEFGSLAVGGAEHTEEEQKTLAQKLEEFLESLDVDHDGAPDLAGIPVAIKKLLGPSK